MCGIAGLWTAEGERDQLGCTLARMTNAIAHRGPDDSGAWIDPENGLALGHRRLSIIDLSPLGAQPMVSASGRYVLAFNGEIYNHAALRADLTNRGCRFRGQSDTEVLLALIDRDGLDDALGQCEGMFAVALWDTTRRALVLARDRLGEKPLYWTRLAQGIAFGSEVKALYPAPGFHASISRGALALFLRHGYIPAPHGIFDDLFKIEPGTFVTFRGPRCEPEATHYWRAEDAARLGDADPLELDDRESVDALEQLLREVVSAQVIADVPLGAFLSGGIDSSLIVALMQAQSARPVKTFTIGFDDRYYDEAPHAEAVARHLGTDHTTLRVTAHDALAVIPRLPAIYDEPFADSSQIPTVLLSSLVRQHVTVALSGDGGDELFGGYTRYRISRRAWNSLRVIPSGVRRAAAGFVTSFPASGWDRALRPIGLHARGVTGERLHRIAEFADVPNAASFYREIVSSWRRPCRVVPGAVEPATALARPLMARRGGLLADMMLRDQISYLPDDILVKVDRATMAASLESRAPFLHHRVAEFAWRMQPRQWSRGAEGKWALRRVLERHVPRALFERPKQGFAVPLAQWLRGPLRTWADDLLAPDALARDGLLDPSLVVARWREHREGVRDWSPALWSILMLQSWRGRWLP
ncbi:MAG: asparagine synthase (glutamine-hydrolyzing) [Gemmatimonadaceae bacterium]